MNFKVAVLISVYKNDNFSSFKQSVESIVNQDISCPVHIYLGIDGNLNENINLYILKNKHLFYKVFHNKKNVGLAYILNRLIDLLEDEHYIFRMDSDDIAYSNRFSLQISYLEQNKDIDICGTYINEIYLDNDLNIIKKYPLSHSSILKSIHKSSPFAHPSVCFRKSIFSNGIRYSTRYHLNEDIDLWFTLLLSGYHMSNIPYVLLDYSMSSSFFVRRGLIKSYNEFICYLIGIYKLNGLTYKLIFPFFRLIIRLLPSFITKFIYKSKFRRIFLN